MFVYWLLFAVFFVIVEVITPSAFVSIWFGVGGVVAALSSVLHAPLWLQITICIIVSILCLLSIRPIATRYLRGNIVKTNSDRLIGEKGLVIKKITSDEWGEVKVNGVIWHAIDVDHSVIEEGERVKIMAIEGVKLIVAKH